MQTTARSHNNKESTHKKKRNHTVKQRVLSVRLLKMFKFTVTIKVKKIFTARPHSQLKWLCELWYGWIHEKGYYKDEKMEKRL